VSKVVDLSTTLDTCFISYMFYHILTCHTSCCCYVIVSHCTFCCYVILTLVHSGVITWFNLFYSTQGALHTDSYLSYILDKPPYRSVFSHNSNGSRSSLKMADYCRNMSDPEYRIKQWYKFVHCVGYFYYV
jgi:hypothetical protein